MEDYKRLWTVTSAEQSKPFFFANFAEVLGDLCG